MILTDVCSEEDWGVGSRTAHQKSAKISEALTYIFKLYAQWKFFAKLQKHTYSLHTIHFSFQVKSSTRGSKTFTTFIIFHTNYDFRDIYWIIILKRFLPQYYVMTLKGFYHSTWFVNKHILTFTIHKQLYMHGFSAIVNRYTKAAYYKWLWACFQNTVVYLGFLVVGTHRTHGTHLSLFSVRWCFSVGQCHSNQCSVLQRQVSALPVSCQMVLLFVAELHV